jgi:SAM-dependent methyltransferase
MVSRPQAPHSSQAPPASDGYAYTRGLDYLRRRSGEHRRIATLLAEEYGPAPATKTLRVCDYGSGFGDLCNALLGRLAGCEFRALRGSVDLIDSDQRLLAYAAHELVSSGHRVRTLTPPAFFQARADYDLIVASHVLYYLSDRPGTVQAFAQKLRHDGLLAITARSASCDTFLIRSAVREAPNVVPPEPGRPRLYVADIEAMVRNAGLSTNTRTLTMTVRFPVNDVCWDDLYAGRPSTDATEFVRFVGHIPGAEPARYAGVAAVECELGARRSGDSYIINIGTSVVTGRTTGR